MKAAHLDIAPCSGLRRREDADGHIRIAHLVEDVLDFALHVFVREISEMPERHRKAGGADEDAVDRCHGLQVTNACHASDLYQQAGVASCGLKRTTVTAKVGNQLERSMQ